MNVRLASAALFAIVSTVCVFGYGLASAQSAAAVSTGQAIVNEAASQHGVAYCEGGGGPHGPTLSTDGQTCSLPGYDCMTLAQFAVYQVTGVVVPENGADLPGPNGTFIPPQSTLTQDESVLAPGDVVFFGGLDLQQYAHSGIYAGGGQVWDDLGSTSPVAEHSMTELLGIYDNNFRGAVRYRGTGGPQPSGPTGSTDTGHGYDLVGSDGGVFVFDGHFYGSLPGLGIQVNDITGMVPTTTDTGYFLVGADGGVFAFDAPFANSLPGIGVRVDDIVGIVPTLDDQGYFLVGRDGGVFSFNAPFENSLPGLGVHVDDIVGIAATHDDRGYWLVAADGSVYAFGDARFFGAAPPGAVAITATSNGGGYWVVGANGTVTPFGNAGQFSDLPSLHVGVDNIIAIVVTGDSGGYNLIGSDGGVFSFGDAVNEGSLPGLGVHVDNVVGAVPT